MAIKKIQDLKKEVSKEEFKKRVVQVAAVSLGTILILSSIPISKACETYKEEQEKIEQQRIEEENSKREISLLSCQVLIENCPDGTVKHHFVDAQGTFDYKSVEYNEKYNEWNYEYCAITDKDFVVSYSEIFYNTARYFEHKELPKSSGEYIFDYNVPYYVMDITDLSLPKGYSLDKLYSINDLKELEEKLNNSIYEDKKEEQSYYARNLTLVKINGEFMCFDFSSRIPFTETSDKEDVTKLRTVYYLPSIGNDLMNLKVSSGMTQVEEMVANYSNLSFKEDYWSGNWAFEDITCLDQTSRNDLVGLQKSGINLYSYLTEQLGIESIETRITKKEVEQLLEYLNSQNISFQR